MYSYLRFSSIQYKSVQFGTILIKIRKDKTWPKIFKLIRNK